MILSIVSRVCPLSVFFGKPLFSSSDCVLIGLFAFAIELYEFLNILESNFVSDTWFPFSRFPFHLLMGFFVCLFCHAEAFSLRQSHLLTFTLNFPF